MNIEQLDVETAFLNGKMEEEVYMRLPQGIERGGVASEMIEEYINMHNQHSNSKGEMSSNNLSMITPSTHCVELLKALYGTKQAAAVWHSEVSSTLISLGFQPTVADPCVFVKKNKKGNEEDCTVVGLFVDDFVVIIPNITHHMEEWKQVKNKLMQTYKMKELSSSESMLILGMRVERDRMNRTITIDQHRYISKVLERFGMNECRGVDTPADDSVYMSKLDYASMNEEEKEEMKLKPYMELVGSLLYAAICTRPDIAHAVAMCSRFMNQPAIKHWKAAKRIMRYLYHTQHIKLKYQHAYSNESTSTSPSTPCVIEVYSDSDWAGRIDDRKSTSGVLLCVNGSPVVWMSKKQTSVALSTAEAEYVAMALAVKEAKWLYALLCELKCVVELPMILYTDNQAAITIATNPGSNHARTKHIDIKFHFIRDEINKNIIKVKWIETKKQLADILTKSVKPQPFTHVRNIIFKQESKQ